MTWHNNYHQELVTDERYVGQFHGDHESEECEHDQLTCDRCGGTIAYLDERAEVADPKDDYESQIIHASCMVEGEQVA